MKLMILQLARGERTLLEREAAHSRVGRLLRADSIVDVWHDVEYIAIAWCIVASSSEPFFVVALPKRRYRHKVRRRRIESLEAIGSMVATAAVSVERTRQT